MNIWWIRVMLLATVVVILCTATSLTCLTTKVSINNIYIYVVRHESASLTFMGHTL